MSGLAVKIANITPVNVPLEPQVKDFCACDFRCDFIEKAFVGNNDYTNDKSSFLFTKVVDADTIAFKIKKNGLEVAMVTDSSYGTYYPTFTTQPLYVGIIIDWGLVYNTFGYGYYTIETDLTILGQSYSIESHKYHVMPFSETMAYKTVKIESYQTGQIISGFDYRNLVTGGWYQSIRLPARLALGQEFEEEKYFDSTYRNTQNRERVIRNYTINFELISDSVHNRLITYEALANYLRLSTYDVLSDLEYRNREVVFEGFGSAESKQNGFVTFDMTFKDRQENIIKRNVSD